MSELTGSEPDASRPVLVGRADRPESVRTPRGGGSRRGHFTDPAGRLARLDASFARAEEALAEQVTLTESLPAADPQLVLVFEAVEQTIDLPRMARGLGFEVLLDAEGAEEPDDVYALDATAATVAPFASSVYAVATNQAALENLLRIWRTWRQTREVPRGRTPLRDLFAQLKDLRLWGPQDRLQLLDWRVQLAEALPDVAHTIEIELWFRASEQGRLQAQRRVTELVERVTELVERGGGRVVQSAVVEAIGYHGLACEVPAAVILQLSTGEVEGVRVVHSADVMYLRASGQQVPGELAPTLEADVGFTGPKASGDPVVCLLDGIPAENHAYLAGRVVVHDPDDASAEAPAGMRRHGTAMASVVVWGDLGAAAPQPAARPVLVRPIMIPSAATVDMTEEIPGHQLVPDLMRRVFRELFDSDGDTASVAEGVVVVNLSVGDPSAPFTTFLSAWARTLDWLSDQYGVLVVVSAGNHPRLPLQGLDARQLTALAGEARRDALQEALSQQRAHRSLLAPAEAINAVTVGALHEDASGPLPGNVLDPTDGTASISPITAFGTGYRRSVKPELAAPGGRVTYRRPLGSETTTTFQATTSRGPGIRVASPTGPRDLTHTSGTSPAAASVSRQAGRLHDLLDRLFPQQTLTRRQRAVAIKALLVHGTGYRDDLGVDIGLTDAAIGHGGLERDLSLGCATHEATVLYLGALSANQAQTLVLPLPDGLTPRDTKRVTATLAWLSPVNWRHRQYRRAKLEFTKPTGTRGVPDLGTTAGVPHMAGKRGANTVQHAVWETDKSFAGGRGDDLTIRVTCREQAGGLAGQSVEFAAVVSLWVVPSLGVDVYSQVICPELLGLPSFVHSMPRGAYLSTV